MSEEVVVIKLPLSIDAVVALTQGLAAVWPDSYVRPFDGQEMHVVLAGKKETLEDDEDE